MHLRTNAPQPARNFNCEAMKASGFRNADILVVDLNDPRLNWIDREEAKRIGEKLYGKKVA